MKKKGRICGAIGLILSLALAGGKLSESGKQHDFPSVCGRGVLRRGERGELRGNKG